MGSQSPRLGELIERALTALGPRPSACQADRPVSGRGQGLQPPKAVARLRASLEAGRSPGYFQHSCSGLQEGHARCITRACHAAGMRICALRLFDIRRARRNASPRFPTGRSHMAFVRWRCAPFPACGGGKRRERHSYAIALRLRGIAFYFSAVLIRFASRAPAKAACWRAMFLALVSY